MINIPQTVDLSLKMDAHGTIRVSGTRVTLETIVSCYQQGDSPEDIHTGFPTVPLADIYTVIAYYLEHQQDVEAYIAAQIAEGERIREQLETLYSPEQKARQARLRNEVLKRCRNTIT